MELRIGSKTKERSRERVDRKLRLIAHYHPRNIPNSKWWHLSQTPKFIASHSAKDIWSSLEVLTVFFSRGSLLGWSRATHASVGTILTTGSTGRQPALSAIVSALGTTRSPVVETAGLSSLTVSMVPKAWPGQQAYPLPFHLFIHSPSVFTKHLSCDANYNPALGTEAQKGWLWPPLERTMSGCSCD